MRRNPRRKYGIAKVNLGKANDRWARYNALVAILRDAGYIRRADCIEVTWDSSRGVTIKGPIVELRKIFRIIGRTPLKIAFGKPRVLPKV
jgi:hypothetical protein